MNIVNSTGKSGVLLLKINEDDVNTILMNTDIDENGSLQYVYDEFANAFSENIMEYAFAFTDIPRNEITKKHREAANSLMKLYEINKLKDYFDNGIPENEWDTSFLRWYRRKGVFGEVILHLILKDFKNTIPLVSKLYFKDSFAQEAKGFDSVHVSEDGTTLWLGETKFYKDSTKQGVKKGGIDELVKDLNSHFVKDYLQEQFVIIRRGLDTQYQHPQRQKWLDILNKPVLLKDVFQYVKVPLLCIYEDSIANDFISNIDDKIKESNIITHTTTLKDYYKSINNYPYKNQVETVLILMPIQAKDKLIKCMLEKIWHMQNI